MSSRVMYPIARLRRRGLRSLPCSILLLGLAFGVASGQSPGDVNCDGAVNTDDLGTLVAAVYDDSQDVCGNADVNGDGTVDGADLVALMHILNAPPPTPVPQGPAVTFFGLAGPDGVALEPLGTLDGAPVFFRSAGSGFKIVVEGAAGLSGAPAGTSIRNSNPTDPSQLPDLLIESSNPLGDGSKPVCSGGVPAVNPVDFGSTQAVADALNDFACRFTLATAPSFACTQDSFGDADFLGTGTQVQFCMQISGTLAFPVGDSIVSLRLRDVIGNLGPMRQLIVRVGNGPVPPTFTPMPTLTPFTPRPTRTPTASARPSFTVSPTPTPTRGLTPGTPTRSPTRPTGTPPSATQTLTHTPTTTATRTTPTQTVTPSPTPSQTPAQPIGPVITFFGLAQSDDPVLPTPVPTPGETPAYRPGSFGFQLVIEAAPGPSGVAVGRSAYQMDLTSAPDLQVEVSQQLGNGSPAVCDRTGPTAGGVPKIDPPNFASITRVINAVNDLGCRFLNGTGAAVGRKMNEACTQVPPTNDYSFVSPDSTIQFCALIDSILGFQPGDTVVTARVLDEDGNPGAPAQIVVHVGP